MINNGRTAVTAIRLSQDGTVAMPGSISFFEGIAWYFHLNAYEYIIYTMLIPNSDAKIRFQSEERDR